ncbi:MAG: hypothetical protein IJI51_01910 [Lachnospiraceae bacterium]|nr:hypothetical protein [Lachnospiraceae bacterium]
MLTNNSCNTKGGGIYGSDR